MKTIDLEHWKRSEADPNRIEYAGQPTAQEVFEELKYRLESTGYLPDEYFLMDSQWENGREIPKGAVIFCTTDYGGSEGVYLDCYLKWYDEEQKKSITECFFTGKTLGENGNDLDRMFLISSAITKAFHGYNDSHTRYAKFEGQDDMGGCTLHLSMAEQKTLINALIEQRERQESALTQTEQLLRRMTGSITAYMDLMGERPLHMSAYDKAVLAIRDGELDVFKELLPRVKDQVSDLFVEAAGRPSAVGRKMTLLLLAEQESFPLETYRPACLKAIEIADMEKVSFLLEQAQSHVEKLPLSFYGELAEAAYLERGYIAMQIIKNCTPEQVEVFPGRLLYNAMIRDDQTVPGMLAQKGINADSHIVDIIDYCGRSHKESKIVWLLRDNLKVSLDNYPALWACMRCGFADAGKQLLDRGMDFEGFQNWAVDHSIDLSQNSTYVQLEEHWHEVLGQQQEQSDGGMSMG